MNKIALALCTCHRLPRGGDPGLMWGNTGPLWGLCNKFLPLWWGKCGDFDFLIPYSREERGDFASFQLRGDKERSIVRSNHGKMVEEKKKVSFKIHWFLSVKRTIKKTVYVFVGISNFKIPLCIYYFFMEITVRHRRAGTFGLGGDNFLTRKNYAIPKWVVAEIRM